MSKTSKKTISVYKRLHIIQKYHRKLLYDLQDPRNFGEENSQGRVNWFSEKRFLRVRQRIEENDDDLDMKDSLPQEESEMSEDETI